MKRIIWLSFFAFFVLTCILIIDCKKEITLPILTTLLDSESGWAVGEVAAVDGGGNISSDGGSPIIGRGVCWSLSPGPTINDSIITRGSGTGIFRCLIYPLKATTTYFIRAYATNRIGTAYGDERKYTTAYDYGL